MKTRTTKNLGALTVSILLALGAASPVGAFKIDVVTTFVPLENIPHAGQPVHEEITRDALTNVTPAISLALIANLQSGAQNSDIIHQFDSESHFDSSSVFLNVGFSNGFATMTQRFEAARQNARSRSGWGMAIFRWATRVFRISLTRIPESRSVASICWDFTFRRWRFPQWARIQTRFRDSIMGIT